jgi:hypothetical protein
LLRVNAYPFPQAGRTSIGFIEFRFGYGDLLLDFLGSKFAHLLFAYWDMRLTKGYFRETFKETLSVLSRRKRRIG